MRIESEFKEQGNGKDNESLKAEVSSLSKQLSGTNRLRGEANEGLRENREQETKVAVQLNTERLKLVDDIFRIISELKKQFPELAQNLEKARDNIPANPESASAKNLTEIFNAIRQILNKPEIINKPEIQETVRNLVNDVIKILQPSAEIPPENKLILALLKNDFASANIAIKNIVEQALRQLQPLPQQQPVSLPQSLNIQPTSPQTVPQVPSQAMPQILPQMPVQIAPQTFQQAANVPQQTFQTFQAILNILQEFKTHGIPQELQKAPLKELETIALQKTGIEIPKNLVKNLSEIFSEKPVFAASSIKAEGAATNPVPTRIEIALPTSLARITSAPVPVLTPTPVPASTPASLPAPALAPFPAPNPIPAQVFEIPLPKNFPQIFTAQTLPQIMQNEQNTQSAQKQEIAFSLHKIAPQIITQQSEEKSILQPWPASLRIPKEERAFWLKTELPLTPQLLNLRETILSFGKLPEKPELVKLFAESLHEISLFREGGKPIEKEHVNLLWRIAQISMPQTPNVPSTLNAQNTNAQNVPNLPNVPNTLDANADFKPAPAIVATAPINAQPHPLPQTLPQALLQIPNAPNAPDLPNVQNTSNVPNLPDAPDALNYPDKRAGFKPAPTSAFMLPQIPMQVTHSLLRYQPHGNYEGELFKSLPEPIRKEILRELPADKAWQPETLQQAIEKIKPNEENRQVLQHFKEQIQWTRIDQDTRPPQDRENVFYFMHNNDLQKGRLKIKDERKGGGKKQQGSSISFSIKTKTKNLGDVNADLTLSRSILNIRLQDSVGNAGKAVEEERETLARELADIGISLGELLYGKTPKVRNLPIAKAKKDSSGLDVKA